MICKIEIPGVLSFETDITTNPLGTRWWSWTEYHWHPYPLGPVEDGVQRLVWCEDPVATHRVMPLGYPPEDQHQRLLCAAEDGRLVLRSPFSFYPILDDDMALEGADEFYATTVQRLAKSPTLF